MVRNRSYEIDMCSGAILPKLLQFALPLMLSSVLQLLFNAADIVVVGRFAGDNSLAAVGSTSSVINLLTNLFIGLSVGANILSARFFGANDRESLQQTVHTSMLLALISGVVMAVIGVCGAGVILVWMQSPEAVRTLATIYLRIYFIGMPATLVYNFGAALLRSVGDTRRPLYYLFTAGVINVLLNLFFVIVCRMDVAGVALATILSQCVSAALVVRCLIRDQGGIHLDLKKLRIWPVRLKQILQVGLPAGLQSIMFALSNVVIQSSVNSFGEVIIAGNSAASNIEGFVYVATNSFYQANLSFTSQNIGAGRYERIRPIFFRALGCVTLVGLVLGCGTCVFGQQLLGIYSDSAPVIEAGMNRLLILGPLYFTCGIMDVLAGSLRGLGYAVMPMLITLIGVCGLRLLWVGTIVQIPALHMVQTVYISYPITWIVTAAALAAGLIHALRKMNRHLSA